LSVESVYIRRRKHQDPGGRPRRVGVVAFALDGRRPGLVGTSFGVGSHMGDVDRLVAGAEQFLDDGPRFAYILGAEGWGPRHDTRDVTGWPGLDPAA
jgi:hypothetical protein